MDAVFLNLLNRSLAAGWLIMAVVLLRLVLQRAPKWSRYILWALVALRLVCPFIPQSAFSLIPSAEPLPESRIMADVFPADTGMAVAESHTADSSSERYDASGAMAADSGSSFLTVLSRIWISGMLALCLQSVVSYAQLKKRVRAAIPFGENIRIGDEVDTPFVMGLFRPTIYLPSDMAVKENQEQMDYVLAHEKMHLRHLDHWWKPLGFLILMIYWFHPLVWLSYVLFCRDMELACDEQVIRDYDMAGRKAYSRALLACSIRHRGIAACPVAFGEVGVKARIKAVLQYKKPGFWMLSAAVLTALAVAVCFLTNPKKEPSLPENPVVLKTEEEDYEMSQQERAAEAADPENAEELPEIVVSVTQMPGEFVTGSRNMTLEDVSRLSAKGWELTWSDFDGFSYYDTGSGLIIHVYLIDQDFSLWVGGGGRTEPMYIYLQENATEERIDIREENVEDFLEAHMKAVQGDVAVRLPLAEAAPDVSGTWLGKADAAVISELIKDAAWQDGTTDCLSSHVFTVEGESLQYHAECGTFNDPANNRHFKLSEEQRDMVNTMLMF